MAHAELVSESDAGFVSRVTVDVRASPSDAWPVMTTPSGWWMDRHTFSGTAANLTLMPSAGGCFCEKLPAADDKSGQAKLLRPGSVEHMRVVYAQPGEALRLVGGLGPLQSEAVSAALTMTLKPIAGGTRITWVYVVGGYTRYKPAEIAKMVDAVMAAQIARLGEKLGVVGKPAVSAVPAAKSPADHKAPNAAFDAAMADKARAKPAAKTPVKPRP
ncbi:SRPBCC family protein [Novosphingobium sp.]|uniref:SRPBCC family protein n=1 Tax=Novosphingobium sp. TaxID=1874826 RepID=UPI0025FAB05B|nr:SRPBCC family protein [Novosphingobium sp.]